MPAAWLRVTTGILAHSAPAPLCSASSETPTFPHSSLEPSCTFLPAADYNRGGTARANGAAAEYDPASKTCVLCKAGTYRPNTASAEDDSAKKCLPW